MFRIEKVSNVKEGDPTHLILPVLKKIYKTLQSKKIKVFWSSYFFHRFIYFNHIGMIIDDRNVFWVQRYTTYRGSLNQRSSTTNTIWRNLSGHFLLGKVPSPLIQITSREGLVQTVGETCRGSLLKNSRYRMWRQLSREHSIPLSCVKRSYIYIIHMWHTYRVYIGWSARSCRFSGSCRLCYR